MSLFCDFCLKSAAVFPVHQPGGIMLLLLLQLILFVAYSNKQIRVAHKDKKSRTISIRDENGSKNYVILREGYFVPMLSSLNGITTKVKLIFLGENGRIFANKYLDKAHQIDQNIW